jgi:2-dehydro-3-deoxy-D-gluconate 5-dehydrogenase
MKMAVKNIQQLFDLKGKVAIVTGSAKGIGKAIAMRLAEAGASVVVADFDKETAAETAAEINSQGWKAQSVFADTRKAGESAQIIQFALDKFGHLDILVNNAGIYPAAPALQVTEELWDNVFNTNLKGMFFYSRTAALEMIRSQRGGKIINLASIDGINPGQGRLVYGTSKAGVIALTKSLAQELCQHKILVNAVAPGAIHTPGLDTVLSFYARAAGITPEMLEAGDAQANTPIGYYGQADDIAKVVLFLASEAANYMTGHTVVVDGGKSIKMN